MSALPEVNPFVPLAEHLLQAASWVSEAHDPDEILNRTGQSLSELAVSVAVYRLRERVLELRASVGPLPLHRPTIPVGRFGFAYRVLQARRAVAVPDCRADPGVSPKVVQAGIGSFIAVPLVAPDGSAVGLIYLNFPEPRSFPPELLDLLSAYGRIVGLALDRAEMWAQLRREQERFVMSLAEAVDARDPYTAGHSRRVRILAATIGRAMGLSPDALNRLQVAALLHDIGKLGVRDGVLLKDGPLTPEEWAEMREHALVGARILASAGMDPEVVDAVRHVHERYAGGGYPAGLRGEEIPLFSRILAVADAFEAMTSDRAYRMALPWEVAMAELEQERGRQFDPGVVDCFCALLRLPRTRNALKQTLRGCRDARLPTEDPARALVELAEAFYAFTLRFADGLERTAGKALAEGFVHRIPVVPVFDAEEDPAAPSEASVRRRLEVYRRQVASMLAHTREVCGERIAHSLLQEALLDLPEEARSLAVRFVPEEFLPPDRLYSR